MPYIDFQEVKRQVTIEQAAQMLGLDLKREQQQLRSLPGVQRRAPHSRDHTAKANVLLLRR